MTISSKLSKAVLNGNGTTRTFPFNFKVWDIAQLQVIVSSPSGEITYPTDWTALLSGNGGTVTYPLLGPALPGGWKIAILRDMDFLQSTDLISSTRFDPQVIENELDEATAERQQLLEAVGRSIKVPATSIDPPETLAQQLLEARDRAEAAAGAAKGSADSARMYADQALQTLGAVEKAGDEQIARIKGEGDTYLNRMALETRRASDEADRAEAAANAIPGLAENRTVFQGYRVEFPYLARYVPSEVSETTDINVYEAYDVLPVLSGWRILDNGHLVLETGFSA